MAVYHCLTLSDTATFATWGLYGVYVFFGISGAVLYHNYHASLSLAPSKPGELSIPQFLLRRFARLAPLLWACILVPALLRNSWVPDRYLLNLSLLNGFGSPGLTSYLAGGWSIGIEVVLYALFPALLAFATSVRTMLVTLAVFLVLRMTFVSYLLKDSTFNEAWGAYIQPAAFLFFFFGGMVIAKVMRDRQIPTLVLAAVGLLCAAGLFVTPTLSFEEAVRGAYGTALTVLSLAIVAAFFWSTSSRPLAWISQFFGDISYGLYLIHPIAWHSTGKHLPGMSVAEHTLLTIGLSTVLAWLSFKFYERPVRTWIVQLVNGRAVALSPTREV